MTEREQTTQPLALQEREAAQRHLQRYPLSAMEQDDGDEQGLNLRDLLTILRRRRVIALNTFVLVVVMGVVLTMISTPRYSTGGTILVEGQLETVAISNTENPLSNLFVPAAGHAVETQVEILRSATLQDKVFKASGVPSGAVALDARVVTDTDLIDFTVTSTSADHAEKFATTLPKVYLQQVKGERISELKAALGFARRRLKEQRVKLDQAELALQQFKQRRGIVSAEAEQTQAITAVSAAQANVREAQSEVAAARGRLAALQSARTTVPSFLESPVTTTNPEIESLKNQIGNLQGQRAQLLFLYKPSDDEVRKVDLQIRQLRRRLASTPAAVTTVSRAPNPAVGNLESQVTDARAALRTAEATLAAARARSRELGAGLTRFNPIERSMSRLQSDVDLARESLVGLTKSLEDLQLREQAAEAKNNPVSVIEAAGPAGQVSPRVTRNILMAIILGAMLACGMALLQNSLDDHVHDEDEARGLLGTPVLGYLPMIMSDSTISASGNGQLAELKALLLSRMEPRFMESFRMLRSNVQFAMVNSPSRSLLVTSTVPGEGKSTTASNLAIAMASDGQRVILIDADMRRPSLDKFFDAPRQPGLSNVLVGQTLWQEALQETPLPGLRLMTSGALPPNPAELLGSPAMNTLLETLQTEADMVIFDTPPCPAIADTQVLAAKVDGVLYVMNLGHVRKAGLHHAFNMLHQANARILGIVFNKFEAASGQGYYYGYGYYDERTDDGTGDDGVEGAADGNGSQGGRHGNAPRLSRLLNSMPVGANKANSGEHDGSGE